MAKYLKWVPISWGECPVCGDDAEVQTDLCEYVADTAMDGDAVRCVKCKARGQVTVDPDVGEAWVNWEDEE